MSKISRAMAVLCLLPVLAAAQLKQPANFPVVKVGKTEFSRGKIDSMVTQLLTQQYRGKQAPQEAVAQMRLLVVENVVAGELVRLEVQALGVKPRKGAVDSLEKAMRDQITAALPDKDFAAYLKKMGYTEAAFHKKVEDQVASEQLAEQVGVSRQTINAIEKGDYNPTINLCIAICKALGKTLDELFWE